MKAELKIENPGTISATIAFTFTLEQWQEVDKALTGAPLYGPTGEIKEAVRDLFNRVCGKLQYFPDPPHTDPKEG